MTLRWNQKLVYANKFSILGFETSLTLNKWYRIGDNCYPLTSADYFDKLLKLVDKDLLVRLF